MTILIKPLQQTKPQIKALIYGPPGAGKTVFCAGANSNPDMGKVLFADVDKGLLSVAHMEGLLTAPISNIGELEELHAMIIGRADAIEGVHTLVIDSLTELYENFMREITSREAKADKRRDPNKAEIQDYGEATARLTALVRWLRTLPMHVLATAHDKVDRRVVDARKKSKHDAQVLAVYPKFPDKLGTSIMGTFDFVWYLAIDSEGERSMLTQPNGVYQAKTRGTLFAKRLGAVVQNPDLSEIYKLLTTSGK